jgi:hypothetical protein
MSKKFVCVCTNVCLHQQLHFALVLIYYECLARDENEINEDSYAYTHTQTHMHALSVYTCTLAYTHAGIRTSAVC